MIREGKPIKRTGRDHISRPYFLAKYWPFSMSARALMFLSCIFWESTGHRPYTLLAFERAIASCTPLCLLWLMSHAWRVR